MQAGVHHLEPSPLDNAVWHSLTTRHERFRRVAGTARRYRPDVSVFGAVGRPRRRGLARPGRAGRAGPAPRCCSGADLPEPPPGWTRLGGGVGHQMVLGELAPVDVPDARPSDPTTSAEMLALVELTRPGPFAVRTVELGGYFGVFDGGQLVAMAGERLRSRASARSARCAPVPIIAVGARRRADRARGASASSAR